MAAKHFAIPFLPSRRVLEHLVDLARLQIVATVVPNAKDKLRLWLPWLHWFLVQKPLDLKPSLPYTVGFVPVNFGPPHPAAGEADHDDTLELAPSPGTITFLQAPTSSYAPEAIVSIRVISPMISKYTCHCTRSRTYRSRLLGGMPSVNEIIPRRTAGGGGRSPRRSAAPPPRGPLRAPPPARRAPRRP